MSYYHKLPGDFVIDAFIVAARKAGMSYSQWRAAATPEMREKAKDEYLANFRPNRRKKAD